ncbi:MAG: AAA family ATPase [Catenulisporales bacterium]|nr:AAA family ATPase [Catenulisporales bacterium]
MIETVGREAELEWIMGRVGCAPEASGIVLLLGAEGVGKSRLLRAAGERAAADGVQVLSARCWIAERNVPFAALHRIFDAGPAVFPERSAQVGPRLRSIAAARASLSRLDGPARTLITVDDVQDCDPPTLAALCWFARHGTGRNVTLLFAARGDGAPPGMPPDADLLHVGPLSRASAAALVDTQPGAPTGRRRLEVLAEAEGNPSALVELSRDSGTHAGHGFEARISPLPPRTRRALLYAAAALPGADLAAIMAALSTDDLGVWAPAELAGLITVGDGRVVFQHPLGRAAALRQPAHLRGQADRDLAAATAGDPARRAQHLAAATLGVDEDVARALTTAARRTPDAFTAARVLEQAAGLAGGDRAAHLAEALVAAGSVGDLQWVRALHEDFARHNEDPVLRCAAACVVAATLASASHPEEAFELLRETLDATIGPDGSPALAVATTAAAIADHSGLPEHRRYALELLARAEALTGAAGSDPLTLLGDPQVRDALHAYVSVGAPHTSPAVLLRKLDHPGSAGLPDSPGRLARRLAIGALAYHADEPETCLEQYRKADAQLRARSAFGIRAWILAPLTDTLLATGRWAEAEALIETAVEEAVVLGMTRVVADLRALKQSLDALRGDAVLTETDLGGHGGDARNGDGSGATLVRLARARALAAAARGDWAEAFRWLRSLFTPDGDPEHPHLSPHAIAELAVAAVRVGRRQDAARVLARVRELQGERPSVRMVLLIHHAAAVVDPETDAEHSFQLALVNPAGEQWPPERALARLSYALWLRRGRRVSEAREQLTAALEAAERLGAAALASAIRAELRASGIATAPEPASTLAGLTTQQQQIVHLAARGLSNREIGEQLFLSPRTIGSHLYNVYPKLGISSRHQLRDLVAGG